MVQCASVYWANYTHFFDFLLFSSKMCVRGQYYFSK